MMRGKGITSGRRRHRPDGSYYRETRRRRVSGGGGGRRMRAGLSGASLAIAVIALVVIVTWMFR